MEAIDITKLLALRWSKASHGVQRKTKRPPIDLPNGRDPAALLEVKMTLYPTSIKHT